MKRILVPTDFSPTAEKAFRFALDIATKSSGTVVLYHTDVPIESTFVGTEKTRKEYNDQSQANALKKLQRLKNRLTGEFSEVSISTVVGRTPLVDNILGFAEHEHVDLLVMGTQGASGLKKTIVGSVAARVMEESDIPILLIPEKYKLENLKSFVFASSFQPSDKQALQFVHDLAKLYGGEITVLHFLSENTTEKENEKEQKDFDAHSIFLQKIFPESNLIFRLEKTPSVIETLEKLTDKISFDIMVMVKRKKTFLAKFFTRSFTQNMSYITTKPLLIIPESEE